MSHCPVKDSTFTNHASCEHFSKLLEKVKNCEFNSISVILHLNLVLQNRSSYHLRDHHFHLLSLCWLLMLFLKQFLLIRVDMLLHLQLSVLHLLSDIFLSSAAQALQQVVEQKDDLRILNFLHFGEIHLQSAF